MAFFREILLHSIVKPPICQTFFSKCFIIKVVPNKKATYYFKSLHVPSIEPGTGRARNPWGQKPEEEYSPRRRKSKGKKPMSTN
jgi:hypothetical protein